MKGRAGYYALGKHFGAECLRVPQVDAAVAAGRHQIVLRGAEGQRFHAAFVGGEGLEDRKTGGEGGDEVLLAFHVPELDGGVAAARGQNRTIVKPDHALHILLMRIRTRGFTTSEETVMP